ncbi:MAG: hypothetical protein L6Q38_18740, partial [Nitrospira sp.]|nr:hypothetical protein [Nitrospira sp.]
MGFQGKIKGERGTPTRAFTVGMQLASQGPGCHRGVVQTESVAALAGGEPITEQLRAMLKGDSRSIVSHGDPHAPPGKGNVDADFDHG